ncbi:MAG: 5-dehydro-4-deoxy-D-glucuronate isomerase [Chitinophagaceae bacterium]|nr:5-dehydro-4-deoxy-D-glucuronate isomerase [Chitinophagaceae bacterium]
MEVRFQNSPHETRQMTTEQLRSNFLVQELMVDDKVNLVYSHYDRVIIGGAKPVQEALVLVADDELKANYFLERREIGIINVGGNGKVTADGTDYALSKLECLYAGKGVKEIIFTSDDPAAPAAFFLLSAPAHQTYPTTKYTKEQAAPVNLGEQLTSNKRTIYKYIHADGIKSCQLVMGLTVLNEGSVWNSVPPHTHTRRMEVYFYFDVPDTQRIFHFMGEPQETRHLVMQNHEAVISAPWSMHYGCGTSNYGFIWAMAGENQVFTDMDPVPVNEIK